MTLNNIVSPQTIKAHEHFNHKNIYLRNPISQGTWKYNSIYQINLPWNCSTAHWSLGVLWSILEITDLSSFHSGVRILNNQRQQLTRAVHWIGQLVVRLIPSPALLMYKEKLVLGIFFLPLSYFPSSQELLSASQSSHCIVPVEMDCL